MANVGPLKAETGSVIWGTPANFNWFHVLPSLLQGRRSPEANQTLHDVSPSPGLAHYVYIFGVLPPNGILPAAKFTLRPSFALSYIGSVTARQSSSGRQPNFAAWYKEWNYWAFAEGATYIRLALFCGYLFPSFFFFPRVISAVTDWMSTILLHNRVALVRI